VNIEELGECCLSKKHWNAVLIDGSVPDWLIILTIWSFVSFLQEKEKVCKRESQI
jgi:predicted DNA-binding protein (MmcQ/YjbR family)